MLFGVKSTFDEELYTTKLEKGPQMRELERQALRIAREIEGEDTQDLHLAEVVVVHCIFPLCKAVYIFYLLFCINSSNFNFSQQERGLYPDDFDIDEETRFSSVYRGKGVDDEYDENEDNLLDSQNSETFGDISDPVIKRPGKVSGGKGKNGAQTWSNFSFMVSPQPVV